MRDYAPETASQQDAGLRDYILRVYNYMTVGLFITGGIAYFSARSQPFINAMYQIQGNTVVGMKPMGWIVMLAPLIFVMLFSFGLQRMSAMSAQVSFWIYSLLVGLSLSTIFLTFTGQSIAQAFFVTAATFGGMSLYGYTTRRDLTGFGSFMFMGLIGIIIASLVNLFLHSPGLQFVISIIGVIVFIGLLMCRSLSSSTCRCRGRERWLKKLLSSVR